MAEFLSSFIRKILYPIDIMSLPVKVEKFTTLQKDFGTTIAVSLWKKAVQNMNYIEKSYPIGMILFVHATQDALPHLPDSKYWQELDGSTISNADSPMNGVTLPDCRNHFFRHPATGETVMTTGGANAVNLSHNHGGLSGLTDAREGLDLDDGGGDPHRAEMSPHQHAIASGGSSSTSTIPQYIALKAFIRII